MQNKIIEVLVPDGYKPQKVEREAAWILARHFKNSVYILRPVMDYKVKTPDFRIGKLLLELKTPTSAKVEKVNQLIREAAEQSSTVVIDIRKTKIIEKRMIEICHDRLKYVKKLQRILVIVNKQKVLDFKKKT
jgi:hypothetical protein